MAHRLIGEKLKELFEELHSKNLLRNLYIEKFLQRAACYFAELNYIHPFREDDGPTTREFMRQLFLLNGPEVDWGAVSVEQFLHSMEESVYDTGELERVLKSVYEMQRCDSH